MANQGNSQTNAQGASTNAQTQANTQTNQRAQEAPQNRQAQQPRQAQQSQLPPALAAPRGREAIDLVQRTQENARPAFKAGQATITAGKAGELSLAFKWIDVPFPDYDSARFDVSSTAPNAIEVSIEQDIYKKKYTGSGAVSTSPIPRAPTGTRGRMIARDTATGETVEVPWVWYDKRGAVRSLSLWQQIKRLIWKGGD
jgi:hypothetical protein